MTNYVNWSSGNAYRYHYSELGFYAIVKESEEVAIMVGGWYHVDHQQREKITINFTFHKPDEMYQNRKILIKKYIITLEMRDDLILSLISLFVYFLYST